jgi:hypothetical protein
MSILPVGQTGLSPSGELSSPGFHDYVDGGRAFHSVEEHRRWRNGEGEHSFSQEVQPLFPEAAKAA